jgi:hypothetical protein
MLSLFGFQTSSASHQSPLMISLALYLKFAKLTELAMLSKPACPSTNNSPTTTTSYYPSLQMRQISTK